MRLISEVEVARPPAEVFDALVEDGRVAGCLPGGRITGAADGGARYAGEFAVNVGPLRAAYSGTVRLLAVDRGRRTVTLRACGREASGLGDADAYAVARVSPAGDGPGDEPGAGPDPDRCKLAVDVELLVRGRVAQLGQGVLGEVGRRLIAEFAGNVERRLAEQPAPPPSVPAGASPGTRKAVAVAAGVTAAVAAGAFAGWWLHRSRASGGR